MVALKPIDIRGLSLITAVGVTAWFAGVKYERWQQRQNLRVESLRVVPSVQPPEVTPITQPMTRYGTSLPFTVITRKDFILAYDNRNKVPLWVLEHLTEAKLRRNDKIDRSFCEFQEDPTIDPIFRSTNDDYKKSGYDRGHLAAAGNHRLAQEHVEETFLLSNIAPQVGIGFNRHAWNNLEKRVRRLTKSCANVYVCTGPLYRPRKERDGRSYVKYEVIGHRKVAVPTHFFKVILMEDLKGEFSYESYIMPNQQIPPGVSEKEFLVKLEEIEEASGLRFFDRIPRVMLKEPNSTFQKIRLGVLGG